jgi:hypothetical protein
MKANTQNPGQPITKQPNRHASTTGAVLAVLSLLLSAIGYGLAHAHYTSTHPLKTTAEKVDQAVANGTFHVLGGLFSMIFFFFGGMLALIAIVLILMRFAKANNVGKVMSVLWLFVAVWALHLVMATLNLLKAK